MSATNLLTSPLGKLRDTTFGVVKGAFGLSCAVAGGLASQVISRVPGLSDLLDAARPAQDRQPVAPVRAAPAGEPRPHGDAVAPAARSAAAKAATKAPATKAPVKKAPVKKAPVKKAPVKRAPSKKAAVTEPALRTAAQDEVVYTTETTGAPAAPDDATPAPQPGEVPLIDPGTARQIAKEAERGLRDAEPS